MAQLQYDEFDGEAGRGLPNFGQLVNATGAIVSLGLIAGLAWWGYQLVVRDVSGVPVVRALEGPMRTAPEDPGGELAVHTGLAVNNIPAEGIAEEPAERLVLVPDTGTLADEDKPAGVLAELSRREEQAPVSLAPDESTIAAAIQPPLRLDEAISNALVEATAQDAEEAESQPELISADVPGVSRSLLPLARPVNVVSSSPAPRSADGILVLSPADIEVGTRLAQLGAFDSAEIARTEWSRLMEAYPEYMTDKARVIEEAQSGGKLFYRLRAYGFEGLADARRFCSILLADEVNCIPVKQR